MAPTKRQLRWQAQRLFRPARRALLRQLFRDDNRRLADSILVAGTARSGTTWLWSPPLIWIIFMRTAHCQTLRVFRNP